mmetsp:Transcript_46118/g.111736  ORF Transcript_46118/g.111736 Transcript_46118/m.111736 type:complete len:215 (-) Transcript_46118:170-814(-)
MRSTFSNFFKRTSGECCCLLGCSSSPPPAACSTTMGTSSESDFSFTNGASSKEDSSPVSFLESSSPATFFDFCFFFFPLVLVFIFFLTFSASNFFRVRTPGEDPPTSGKDCASLNLRMELALFLGLPVLGDKISSSLPDDAPRFLDDFCFFVLSFLLLVVFLVFLSSVDFLDFFLDLTVACSSSSPIFLCFAVDGFKFGVGLDSFRYRYVMSDD